MVLVILVCVGLAIYCFMNGMIGIGFLALGGLLHGLGFISLILAAVFLFIQEQYIAASFPPFLIAWNLWGLHILKKQRLEVDE